VFALAAIGFVRLLGSEGTPAGEPRSPFEGTWVSTSDTDGGTQTMTVRVSGDDAVEITVRDDVATVCSGTPSTMTGTGRIEAGTALVIPAPVYTCDDGSEPEALSGPPLQEQLRDWTLVLDPQTDTLSDGFGGLWLRPGAESPSPAPTASGGMWPQTTLEEVRQAQELADEGDPAYAWQVDPTLAAGGNWEAEIFERFIREEIGWEEFKERGIAAYSGLGTAIRSLGNACDMEVGEPIVPLAWHTEKKELYPTLTRRIQFYIDHDWYLELEEHLPTHKDCPKAGGDYPLQVTGGHTRWSMHSDWIDDSIILSLQRGEPVAVISVKDAESRGVRDGEFLEVYNDVGNFRIQAMVSPAVRPGQIIIYHGWENYQFQGLRHFKSVMPNPLNPIEMVGGYGHLRSDVVSFSPSPSDRGTRVEIRKSQ